MSGHWRLCIGASLLLAGLSTSPAFSNPFTDLFTPAPQETPAPAPAKEECSPQPGRATPGQHWVYRLDGHRKCWFQAEASVAVKRLAQRHAPRRHFIEPEEDEAALHTKRVADARAQLLSNAQANALQPAPPAPPAAPVPAPAPAPEVAETASVPASEAATPTPAAPVVAAPSIDQPAPARAAQPQVDVESLLAAAAPIADTVATPAPSTTPVAPSVPTALNSQWESVMTLAGAILMVFGLVFLVGTLLAAVARRKPARMA
jgi:hypothetical protein